MTKKVYLAGPMSGIPYFNFPAFMAAAEKLRAEGYEVFNPAQNDIDKHGGVDISADNPTGDPKVVAEKYGFSLRDALCDDLTYICKHATHIAFLPGWEKSSGARAEFFTAAALGHEFIYLG